MACKFDDAPAFLDYIRCEDVFGAERFAVQAIGG